MSTWSIQVNPRYTYIAKDGRPFIVSPSSQERLVEIVDQLNARDALVEALDNLLTAICDSEVLSQELVGSGLLHPAQNALALAHGTKEHLPAGGYYAQHIKGVEAQP